MRYDPNQAQQPGGEPGTYRFTVGSAVDTIAKSSGSEMIKLVLLADVHGRTLQVYDYLVNSPGGLWKTKLFCKEVGLDFNSGVLKADDCAGKGGVAVFDYDKKDVAKVAKGEIERAYLKVTRYGVHKEKSDSPASDAPSPVDDRSADNAKKDAIEYPTDDIPF